MVENLRANASVSMRFIHYHLVHIADICFAPQVALDSERTETDNLMVKNGANINLPVRDKRTAIHSAKRIQIHRLARPKLAQECYDAVKVLRFGLSYLNHGCDEGFHAA